MVIAWRKAFPFFGKQKSSGYFKYRGDAFFWPNKVFSGHGKAGGAGICLLNKEFSNHGKAGSTAIMGAKEESRNYCKARGTAFFWPNKESCGNGMARGAGIFPNNEFSDDGKAGGYAICWWFGCNVKLGNGGNDFGGNKDGQKRTVLRCQFKASIDFKTQFVAHVLIWYTILPKPPFINK